MKKYFIVWYWILVANGRRKRKGIQCQYSTWLWTYLIAYFILNWRALVDTKQKFQCTKYLVQKTWAISLGTQLFWIVDEFETFHKLGSRFFRKVGRKYNANNIKHRTTLHTADQLVHTIPFLIMLAHVYKHKKQIDLTPEWGSGMVLYLFQLGYTYLVTGNLDPSCFYSITSSPSQIRNGWLCLLVSYLSSDFVLKLLHDAI